jgi:hypothetical protein
LTEKQCAVRVLLIMFAAVTIIVGGTFLPKLGLDFTGLEIIMGGLLVALSIYTFRLTWREREETYIMFLELMAFGALVLFIGILLIFGVIEM